MDEYTLLESLFGAKRAEGGTAHMETATMTGVAVEDSDGGQVRIIPDGHVAAAEGEDNTITIPTSPNVEAGDNVLVSMTGGVSKSPMVIGVVASGDRIKGEIDDFKEYADVTYTHETEFDEVTGAISNTITANYSATAPNISPFFSFDEPAADSITNDYWARYAANPSGSTRNTSATVTPLSDGWLHIVKTAGSNNVIFAPKAQPFVSANGKYTLLFEFRNVTVSGTNRMQIANVNYGQLCATGTSYYFQVAEGMQRFVFPSDGLEIRSANSELVRFNLNSALVVTCDMRVSLYEGEYLGGYKPYSLSKADAVKEYATRSYVSQSADAIELEVSQTYLSQADASTTYATKSALEIATDSISSLVQGNATYTDPVSGQTVTSALGTQVTQSASDVSTLLTDVGGIQTMIRETTDGILVAKTGNTVGALVNADGSFDVVELSWSGDTPTIGDALASFDASEINLGNNSSSSLISFCAGRGNLSFGYDPNVSNSAVLSLEGKPWEEGMSSHSTGVEIRNRNVSDDLESHVRITDTGEIEIRRIDTYSGSENIISSIRMSTMNPYGEVISLYSDYLQIGYPYYNTSYVEMAVLAKILRNTTVTVNQSYTGNGAHFETDTSTSASSIAADVCGRNVCFPMKLVLTSNYQFSSTKIAQIADASCYPSQTAQIPVFCISANWSSPSTGWMYINTSGEVMLWTAGAVGIVFAQVNYTTV